MPPNSFIIGSPVKVVKGGQRDAVGRVTRITPCSLYIQSTNTNEEFMVRQTSVILLDGLRDEANIPSPAEGCPIKQAKQRVVCEAKGDDSENRKEEGEHTTRGSGHRQGTSPSMPAIDEASTPLSELKRIIDEEGLPVKTNVGGKNGRTKADIVADIHAARAQKDPSYTPATTSVGAVSNTKKSSTRGAAGRTPSAGAEKGQRAKSPTVRGRSAVSTPETTPYTPPTFQIPAGPENDSAMGNAIFAGMRIDRIILEKVSTPPSTSFLCARFGAHRVLTIEIPVVSSSLTSLTAAVAPITKALTVTDVTGFTKEFLFATLKDDGQTFFGAAKKKLELTYVITSGPKMTPIDLREELLLVADFSVLTARKAASRLELLLSESKSTKLTPQELTVSDFEIIDEPVSAVTGSSMSEGLGYIPEHMLERFLGMTARTTTTQGKLGIQVRIFAPKLGIYKGVLMSKPNIDKIQLTSSMRKVLPSREGGGDSINWVYLVIVQKFPSDQSHYLGKSLVTGERMKSLQPKPFKDMIHNLLTVLGVPSDVLTNYEDSVFKEKQIPRHSWVVGLADPWGKLPAGSVFLTGVIGTTAAADIPNKILVSRSPCILPSDGRLLPVITTRPADMSEDQWQWLVSLPFGGILFSTAGGDTRPPIPMICASGDLDGDLYITFWDRSIIEHVVEREPRISSMNSATATTGTTGTTATTTDTKHRSVREQNGENTTKVKSESTDDWFDQARMLMLDPTFLAEKLAIGKLYKAAEKIYNETGSMDSEDYVRLAEAYLQAIDMGKYGGALNLPQHLRERVGL